MRYHPNSKVSYTREQFYKIVAKQFPFTSLVLQKQSQIYKPPPSSAFQKVKYLVHSGAVAWPQFTTTPGVKIQDKNIAEDIY